MSSSGQRPKSHEMTKTTYLPDDSVINDKKKKSIIPKIFGSKLKNEKGSEENIFSGNDAFLDRERRYTTGRTKYLDANPMIRKSFSERQSSGVIEGFNLSHYIRGKKNDAEIQDFRIFVATWNVGGKCPDDGLNLEDFLQVEGSSDIYIVGFQEIVPLNAGNVLVVEDNEPAAKWLCLINQALNRPTTTTTTDSFHKDADCSVSESPSTRSTKDSKASAGGLLFFQKPSLKVLSRKFRANASHLKTCNCNPELALQLQQRRSKDLNDTSSARDESGEEESITCLSGAELPSAPQDQMSYCLISSKQMVGIFLSVWARHELVRHIGHLRVCTVGTGIMGCLGNKGCISVSMTLHQTSFCFVCSHLASGEKEGDELRRNADVAEILKSTQFPRMCKSPNQRIPEKILDHDRVIWLGDLNYRIALSYNETRVLLEDNDWDALLEKDQLRMEMEAGRVFTGWSEGRILFAPTYKYSQNSDAYAGETVKSKKKRRTPAWCDRILWHGDGIEQLSYIRVESRFSDHRPVCAVFVTEIQLQNSGNSSNNNYRGRKSYSSAVSRMEVDDCIPQRQSFYEY